MEALTKASREFATMKWSIVQLDHEVDKQKILLFIIIVVERGKSVIWSRSRPVYAVMYGVIRIVLYIVCIRHRYPCMELY